MIRKSIFRDMDACINCKACIIACQVKQMSRSYPTSRAITEPKGLKLIVRVYQCGPEMRGDRVHQSFVSIACMHCEDAPCIKACPRKALTKDEKTGIILVDENKCTGCAWCIEACEFGAITLHPTKNKVVVCDLCSGDPKCVKFCPTDALELTTPEQISQKARKTLTKGLAEKLLGSTTETST